MKSRKGFSFIELLVTMLIIGLLASIAIPKYHDMKRRAMAASIIGDVHAIRIAAFSHYTEHGAFPPDAGSGQLPPLLVDNLPTGFTFDRPDFDFDWDVWAQGTESLVGITVSVTDTRLAAQLIKSAGPGYLAVVTPTSVTFLVSSSS
jgi:prepilin-type N-terminal cleavage/methylation domain-containing protein